MKTLVRVVTIVGLFAAVAVAGCGDTDGDTDGDTGAAGSATGVTTGDTTGDATDDATGDPTAPGSDSPDGATEGLPTATVTADDDVAADAGGDPGDPADWTDPTAEAVADPSGDQVLFTDLRIGRQGDVDRVVWEFAGSGTPGWRVGYTDDPSRQGSGTPVDLPGGATLQVLVDNVGIPGDVEVPDGVEYYDGAPVRAAAATEVVTEVVAGGTFEGVHDAFVGVTTPAAFRVYLLRDPTRVVVEVRSP